MRLRNGEGVMGMARPGLYDALVKLDLIEKGRVIALGDGTDADKASHLDRLIGEAGGDFNVTPRAVFILRGRLSEQADRGSATDNRIGKPPQHLPRGTPRPGLQAGPAPTPKPPPGPNRGSFKKGDPRIKPAPKGHDRNLRTGEHRNPLLHGVDPQRAALVMINEDMSPADLLRQSIMVHRLAILDMTREIEAIQASTKRWWWLGSTYTRQEGDGEIMGTGRISQRKRVPREEALQTMIEARSRVQGKLDSAVEKLHKMEQADQGRRKRGLADLLLEMRQAVPHG